MSSHHSRRIRAALASLLVLAGVGMAQAQALTEDRQEEARGVFDAARAAFEAGRYQDALVYFERSYRISHLPEILYNIAQTADRMRHDERALTAFEEYLALVPDTEERAAIESRIRVLRASVEERARNAARERDRARQEAARAGAPRPEDPDPMPSPTSEGSSGAGWVVLGVGGAVAVAGAVLVGMGAARADEVRSASEGTPWADVRQAHADADGFAIAGGVLLGAGVAAIAAGAVWGIVELASADAEVALGPGRLELRGSF